MKQTIKLLQDITADLKADNDLAELLEQDRKLNALIMQKRLSGFDHSNNEYNQYLDQQNLESMFGSY